MTFLYIARGSAGEVRSMLHLLRELLADNELVTAIEDLRSLSVSITRQLNGWLDSLKKTKAVGHRHQTDERREVLERGRKRDDFLAYLKQVQEGKVDENPPMS